MRSRIYFFLIFFLLLPLSARSEEAQKEKDISPETQACIECHAKYTPGIVQDWRESRHSKLTPANGMQKPALKKRISAQELESNLKNVVVGCFECHGRNPQAHKDSFDHFGYRINVVVSPKDCAACHPVEESQYSQSKKANANINMENNPLFTTLYSTILGVKIVTDTKFTVQKPSEHTKQDSCFGCHGTVVQATGMKELDTEFGKILVPNLTNWPNAGVGRINPDGSKGACTSCHPRHSFSIEIARKPYTCLQCHIEPDVPAWDVYLESKHGTIFTSKGADWNFNNVPWRPGQDFRSATCAVCHMSLLAGPSGVIADRNHDFGARLWVRIFGLPYSHPQPKQGNTTNIRNIDGLPLPTAFNGLPASKYLIEPEEQTRRENIMKAVCGSCHGKDWVNGYFEKFQSTVKEADEMVLAGTKLMNEAWEMGLADRTNPFDEELEQDWVHLWLFDATTTRYASAMSGPDYAAFKYGFWGMSTELRKMKEEIELKKKILKGK